MGESGDAALLEVVGIGASAGGLEALSALLEGFEGLACPAIVIVTHLAPDQQTFLHDILSRRSEVPIALAENAARLEPGRGYVIPPGQSMIVSQGRLLLSERDPAESPNLPIDVFLRSLAADYADRAAAVILSGTGSDGSRGVEEIHANGGLVVVQEPEDAAFRSMPDAAIDTGVVDLVVPAGRVGQAIHQHGVLRGIEGDDPDGVSIARILGRVRTLSSVDFRQYKRNTVLRRLQRRVATVGVDTLEAYEEFLEEHPDELDVLYRDLLIGVTRFYRDGQAFRAFKGQVSELLGSRRAAAGSMRIWAPGSSTGEEAYSIAMAVTEVFEEQDLEPDFRVFATDIHPGFLESASLGWYDVSALEDLSDAQRERWFVETRGETCRVTSDLRDRVVFARHDVTRDPPFTRVDIVVCRNLLIYFQPETQRRVMTLFHFALLTGGILFLGPSESTGRLSDEFTPLDRRWRVYRKRRDIRLHPDFRTASAPARKPLRTLSGTDIALRALVDAYAPPTILVDNDGRVVHSFAGGGRFLRQTDGPPSNLLLDQLSGDLKNAVSAALQGASHRETTTWYRGIQAHIDGDEFLADVQAAPLSPRAAGVMVQVRPREDPHPPLQGADRSSDDLAAQRVTVLEGELRETQENLQAALEEMETANEELQATNEELIASNEELQSTNEELSSVNEELYTVNSEHQQKIEELQRLSRDLDYVLAGGDIHVLFLDGDRRIRKFTSGLRSLLNLMPHDVGRSIDLFANQLAGADWLEAVDQVARTGERQTLEVVTEQGRLHQLKVQPYQTPRGVEGTVVILSDLSDLRALEAQHRRMADVLRLSPDVIIAFDETGRISDVNQGARNRITDTVETMSEVLERPERLFEEAMPHALAEGAWRGELILTAGDDQMESSVVVVASAAVPGHPRLLTMICRDIGELKRAQRLEIRQAEQKDRFLAALSHELRNPIGALVHAATLLKGSPSQQTVSRVASIAERQLTSLERLVDDLLDQSRMNEGRILIEKRVLGVVDAARQALDTLRMLEPDEPVTLRIDSAELLWVAGDPDRLQQMLVNLLTNAVRYGLGRPIAMILCAVDDEVRIEVRDQGVGLEEAQLQAIFQPFFRVDEQDRQGGVGIGLTLTRRLAELHGGSVAATSDGLGHGASFVLTLPRVPAPEGAPVPAPTKSRPAGQLDLLLVDDNADILDALELLLTLEGHTARKALTLAQGLARLEERIPDVVLCDIGLPDGDGRDLARTWAGREDAPRMIAVSGWGDAKDIDSSLEAGFERHLTKPVDVDELLVAIQELAGSPVEVG